MKRIIRVLLLFLAVALPAIAEEISLKDGTKIVGHMTQVTADKIEVETTYGKVQLKRSDILSINFVNRDSDLQTGLSNRRVLTESYCG